MHPCDAAPHQGDQIEQIFYSWVKIYLRQFFENFKIAQILALLFSLKKLRNKMRWATVWVIFYILITLHRTD
jgi:hypothetical protein